MKSFANTQESWLVILKSSKRILQDAWRDNSRRLLLVLFFSALIACVPYVERGVQALLVNHVVRLIPMHQADAKLALLLGIVAAVFFCRDSLRSWANYIKRVYWQDRRTQYELALDTRLATLDVATHEDPTFKNELQVVHEYGSAHVMANFFDSVIDLGQSLIGFCSAFIIVCIADWRLAGLVSIASIPQLYVELRFGKAVWSAYTSHAHDRRLYHAMKRHAHTPTGVRELHTYQTAPYFLERMRVLYTSFIGAQMKELRTRTLLMILCDLILAAAIVLALVVLVGKVLAGGIEIGTFIFVFASVMALDGEAGRFVSIIAGQRRDVRMLSAFFSILDRDPRIVSPSSGARLRTDQAPRIEFKDVSFAYPGSPDQWVLRNFSLSIEPGERIAFVGVNGAGKSTLIKLLARIYDPTEGAILLNGIDLRRVSLDSWYEQLALLAQDFEHYQLPVSEFIGLGRIEQTACQQSVERAAIRSGASLFIGQWPNGYQQQIGVEFGGVNPSGGQRQSLALSRALYRDALVTVLDEPAAHIDADAEQAIFERLETDLSSRQTLVLISHRFSTVRRADRICVVKDGEVHELGSHDVLMAQGGTYARLFTSQAEGYR